MRFPGIRKLDWAKRGSFAYPELLVLRDAQVQFLVWASRIKDSRGNGSEFYLLLLVLGRFAGGLLFSLSCGSV